MGYTRVGGRRMSMQCGPASGTSRCPIEMHNNAPGSNRVWPLASEGERAEEDAKEGGRVRGGG